MNDNNKNNDDDYSKKQEVSELSAQIWRGLPAAIRGDSSLSHFREEYERLHECVAASDTDEYANEINEIVLVVGDNTECPLLNDSMSHESDNESTKPKKSSPGLEFKKNDVIITLTNDRGEETDLYKFDELSTVNETYDFLDKLRKNLPKSLKCGILITIWILFTYFITTSNEKFIPQEQFTVENNQKYIVLENSLKNPRIGITLIGHFMEKSMKNSTSHLNLTVQCELVYINKNREYSKATNISNMWTLPVVYKNNGNKTRVVQKSKIFEFNENFDIERMNSQYSEIRIKFETNLKNDLTFLIEIDRTPINRNIGVIFAGVVLFGLYVMIIWEIVHRTFASIICSTAAIGILSALNQKPSMAKIIGWIDIETLLLLFGMMILVAILSETGLFDYLAIYAYKITNGKIWSLINCLCIFSAVLSSFLDNVTTVLLMTPVSIRLCEVLGLNPVPILMSMLIYSNIGGALTPVGDPPNVIIASNSYIEENGITFMTFTIHMALGIFMVMIQTYFQLRYYFKNTNDLKYREHEIQEIRHEISVWQRAAASLSSYSKDEDLVRDTLNKKVKRLTKNLKKKLTTSSIPFETYRETLEELQRKYPIRSKSLLIKAIIALTFVVSFFFLNSVPSIQGLSLGWTALLGAMLLIILADIEDIDGILSRVEWSTLIFFSALFVLMEALGELGLITWIGLKTEMVIASVDKEYRLAVAILIILWVSALVSAFVDNIPLTTMMLKIAISLAENPCLELPLQPLVWALAFGACLGGNGTLIGSSANVVCAGVAEQHGYRFTFLEYFKIGFPITVVSVFVSSIYLIVFHVFFHWH